MSTTSGPPRPPRSIANVLQYRERLSDALTGGAIDHATQLVSLHQPDPLTSEGQLVRNLTAVARPAQPCYIVALGARFPPVPTKTSKPPYELSLTCNRLLLAPTLRLECVVPRHGLTIAIEFHFMVDKAPGVAIPGVTSFTVLRDEYRGTDGLKDEIRFHAVGATSEGLNKAHSLRDILDEPTKRFVEILKIYTQKETDLRLRFPTSLSESQFALASLLPFLPGGEMPLTSLTVSEWSALLPLIPERNMESMKYHPSAPYPFVTLESGDTFSTPNHASVELYESSRISYLEQQVLLKEWSSVRHTGVLCCNNTGGPLVMAVWFAPIRHLSGVPSGPKFELPDRFRTQIRWEDADGKAFRTSAQRTSTPLPGLHADALFVISKYTDAMKDSAINPRDLERHRALDVTLQPSMPQSSLRNKLDTAISVAHTNKWQQILLNQDHSTLSTVDLATERMATPSSSDDRDEKPLTSPDCLDADADHEPITSPEALDADVDRKSDINPNSIDSEVEIAYQWMLKWRPWNAEQLQALQSIRKAVGGVVLITGPAGTGKTLVLQAIVVFLYLLDLHILVVCPANANCADFVGKLKEYFGTGSKDHKVEATRVYSQTVDFSPTQISKDQHLSKPSGGTTADSDSVYEFEFMSAGLRASDPKYTDHSDYGLPAQVFQAAKDRKLTHHERISKTKDPLDIWVVLRECMDESEQKRFDWGDPEAAKTYQMAYDRCKAHYIAKSRLIVTTTGNVRCSDLTENWARDKHELKCKGIVVVLDEACKDQEIDTLSPLLWPEWKDKITGLVMLGDDRQLEPTNTGAKGQIVFNPFNDRVSTPLLSRLKRQGFPCTELVEQHRMSCHISEWPFSQFYPPGMRNGKHTYSTLKVKLPGLDCCLESILKDLGEWDTILNHPMLTEQERDKVLRAHYFEIDGRRDKSTRSPFVLEHVRFFFDKLYWPLHAYFGEKTNEKVMIICAYKEQKNCYDDAARRLKQVHQIPDAQMPRICTIDSSQGTEAPITVIDCSVQQFNPKYVRSDIGFVDDDKRMNVALTRAQEVRWILGGHCNVAMRSTGQPGTPAYVRYKEKVSWSGQLTTVGRWPKEGRALTRDGGGWLKGLKKQYLPRKATYNADTERKLGVV